MAELWSHRPSLLFRTLRPDAHTIYRPSLRIGSSQVLLRPLIPSSPSRAVRTVSRSLSSLDPLAFHEFTTISGWPVFPHTHQLCISFPTRLPSHVCSLSPPSPSLSPLPHHPQRHSLFPWLGGDLNARLPTNGSSSTRMPSSPSTVSVPDSRSELAASICTSSPSVTTTKTVFLSIF